MLASVSGTVELSHTFDGVEEVAPDAPLRAERAAARGGQPVEAAASLARFLDPAPGDQAATARYVLSKSTGAVLLLTACIEWLTQLHYTEAFREDGELEPFTKRVFHAHWLEESQHAQMDHLETLRAFEGLDDAGRDRAVDDLIELVGAVDGLLRTQVGLDVENLARALGRGFTAAERADLEQGLLRAKRWTFLFSGVTHPRFEELLHEVTTPAQRERIGAALQSLASPSLATA